MYTLTSLLLFFSLDAFGFAEGLKKAEEGSDGIIRLHAGTLGTGRFLLHPPCANPMTIYDVCFTRSTHEKWLASFWVPADFEDRERQTYAFMPMFSVLNRTNSTVAFKFTYDPKILLDNVNA